MSAAAWLLWLGTAWASPDAPPCDGAVPLQFLTPASRATIDAHLGEGAADWLIVHGLMRGEPMGRPSDELRVPLAAPAPLEVHLVFERPRLSCPPGVRYGSRRSDGSGVTVTSFHAFDIVAEIRLGDVVLQRSPWPQEMESEPLEPDVEAFIARSRPGFASLRGPVWALDLGPQGGSLTFGEQVGSVGPHRSLPLATGRRGREPSEGDEGPVGALLFRDLVEWQAALVAHMTPAHRDDVVRLFSQRGGWTALSGDAQGALVKAAAAGVLHRQHREQLGIPVPRHHASRTATLRVEAPIDLQSVHLDGVPLYDARSGRPLDEVKLPVTPRGFLTLGHRGGGQFGAWVTLSEGAVLTLRGPDHLHPLAEPGLEGACVVVEPSSPGTWTIGSGAGRTTDLTPGVPAPVHTDGLPFATSVVWLRMDDRDDDDEYGQAVPWVPTGPALATVTMRHGRIALEVDPTRSCGAR